MMKNNMVDEDRRWKPKKREEKGYRPRAIAVAQNPPRQATSPPQAADLNEAERLAFLRSGLANLEEGIGGGA